MEFRVGPYLYTVRQVAGYIDHQGEPCLGLCDNEKHEMLISDQASAAQQIQVVCHEYMEAWVYHFGANLTDKEDYCDLFGLAMAQFVMDFIKDMQPVLQPDAAGAVAKLIPQADRASTTTADMSQEHSPMLTAPQEGGPYRVTRIYEPSPKGSTQPWLMRVIEQGAKDASFNSDVSSKS